MYNQKLFKRSGVALLITSGIPLVSGQNRTVEVSSGLSTYPLSRYAQGFSIEATWVNPYINTSLLRNLLDHMTDVTGTPPPIRVGGGASDETLVVDTDLGPLEWVKIPNNSQNITTRWYKTWPQYFPDNTKFVYTLNLADNSSDFATARAEAQAAYEGMGDSLTLFELGNEVDQMISAGTRAPGWNVQQYIEQFRNVSGAVTSAAWYTSAVSAADSSKNQAPPKFRVGNFLDSPLVADPVNDLDDFSIANVTASGLVDPAKKIVDSYGVHMYSLSRCTPEKASQMSLAKLSNHDTVWSNVSQYISQVAAAEKFNSTLIISESASIKCTGQSGISDTFGSALWAVDLVLQAASVGLRQVYFHNGGSSQYSSINPVNDTISNQTVVPDVRANFYGHYFLAHVLKGLDTTNVSSTWNVAALPSANQTDFSGYSVYGADGTLAKLIFLDMGIWNGSSGLSNPSTPSATDGTVFSNGQRPLMDVNVATPWGAGTSLNIIRLNGPGSNAKSAVNVSGVWFDAEGNKKGTQVSESLAVGTNGQISFSMNQSQGVLLELSSIAQASGVAGKGSASWGLFLVTVAMGFFIL